MSIDDSLNDPPDLRTLAHSGGELVVPRKISQHISIEHNLDHGIDVKTKQDLRNDDEMSISNKLTSIHETKEKRVENTRDLEPEKGQLGPSELADGSARKAEI